MEIQLTRNIRLRRLHWVDHVMKIKGYPKEHCKETEKRRQIGRPRGRQLHVVERDAMRRMMIRNRREP
jgi:hypothetical protein